MIELTHDTGEEANSWEGQVSVLKRTTEKSVEKATSKLMKRIDKVHNRVIEAETRDATQEREMKDSFEKLMKTVQTQIQEMQRAQD